MVDHATADTVTDSFSHLNTPVMDLDEQLYRLDLHNPDPRSSTSYPGPLALDAKENTPPFIHMLPIELMVNIFLELDDLPRPVHVDRPAAPAKWLKVMLVCRRWSEIITSNPCFWRVIYVRRRVKWFKLAISRSMGLNLQIYCNRPRVLVEALPQLLGQSYRVEVLSLTRWELVDLLALRPLISATLPALTVFHLYKGSRFTSIPEEGGFLLDEAHYPSLTDLNLERVHLSWTPLLLSRLRSLRLKKCKISPSTISLATFLDVLECGTQLEVLNLQSFVSSACHTLAVSSNRTGKVVLPRLRSLDIYDDFDHVLQFLTFVQIPSSGDVSITSRTPPALADLNAFQHLDLFGATTSARMRLGILWDWDIRLVAAGLVPLDVSMRIPFGTRVAAEAVDGGLRFLLGILRGAPLESLALMVPPVLLNPVIVRPLLDAFPRLLVLEITACRTSFTRIQARDHLPNSFFRLLCQTTHSPANPSAPVPNGAAVRCPLLKELRLYRVAWNDNFVRELVRCLTARARLGASKLETLLLLVPARSRREYWERELDSDQDGVQNDSHSLLPSLVGTYVIDTDFSSD
ncbi:hypothetical protein FKP32DRAFT_1756050 [Trametes sanguinea]|nr:hypothetical protein FKP32DRAFT_1756050 [Trametes sanguinea]